MMNDNKSFNDDDQFSDFDEDDFNDFDQAQKGSLSDMWNSSPWPKIAALVLGVVTIIFGLSLLGGGNNETPESIITSAPDQRETPGQNVPEAYREAVEEVNQQRLLNALETGQSAIPIPVGGNTTDINEGLEEQDPPQNADDPLAQWRQRSAPPPEPVAEEAPALPEVEPIIVEPAPQPIQYFQPDPEAVGNLAGAMSAQMQEIMDRQAKGPLQHMEVTAFSFYTPPSQEGDVFGNGSASDDNGLFPEEDGTLDSEQGEVVIPAGAVLYGQVLNEANSDTPGPVLARILNGEMAGTRIIGSFQSRNEKLIITFDRVVINGEAFAVNAVALDPETSVPGIATDVDKRYWRRVVLPAAARFVEGLGQAIEEEGKTEVTVNNETVTSSNNEIDTRQELFAGVNEAAREFGDVLDDEADRLDTLVRVEAGTMIGLLFTQAVHQPGIKIRNPAAGASGGTAFTESPTSSSTQ